MKKSLLLSLTCLASCAFAQRSFFGVDAGINVANQRIVTHLTSNGAPVLDAAGFQSNKVQPTFGVFYHLHLSEVTSVQANAQYMGLGYNSRASSQPDVDINYLTFPITFHYHANKHFSLNTGPYISFTLGGTKINNQDITKTYHKNDFGFSFGGEHDLYMNFSLGINYFVGLKNIWLNDTQTVPGFFTTTNKYTNRAIQVTLIYKFKKPI
jgi:hypothetical protein